MKPLDLRRASSRELLSLFGRILEELKRRGAVRSVNNPVADYAEAVAARCLSLTLKPNANKGCDAVDTAGQRYEIKSRRITRDKKSARSGVMRQLDEGHFDFLVGILFDKEFRVDRACLIPHSVVRSLATYTSTSNGWIVQLRPLLWMQPGVRDITQAMREAQDAMPE
jgi:hypothetical protein